MGRTLNGNGVSPEQEATLEHFGYNTSLDRLVANRAIETDLNSFYLGKQHKISSGGENVFFSNLSSGNNYWPAWCGLKDQAIVGNQDSTGIITPSMRIHSDALVVTESNGASVGSGAVDCKYTFTVPASGSYFSAEFEAVDEIVASEWMHYEVFWGNDDTGVKVYMQDQANHVVTAGSSIKMVFDHPLDVLTGDTVTVAMYRRTSPDDTALTYLQVVPGVTTPAEPYRKFEMRPFEDVGVQPSTSKLCRSADGVWEAVAMGEEYVSPDQHGGVFGDVYRKYITLSPQIPGATLPYLLGVTITNMITISGSAFDGGVILPIPYAHTEAWVIMAQTVNHNAIEIYTGSSRNISAGAIWIDYTR